MSGNTHTKGKLILILGGARSGKSHFAQDLAQKLGGGVLFVATGEPLDEEMQRRIDAHRKTRPAGWRTLELPTRVGKKLARQAGDAEVVIIDCLTLLISNLLTRENIELDKAELRTETELKELIDCLNKLDANIIIVSNEVGMGLVPESSLGRVYRDLLGKCNQILAQQADEVYLMVAGIPLKLKASK